MLHQCHTCNNTVTRTNTTNTPTTTNCDNTVAHTFLLTRSIRTKDPWLKVVLSALRYGSESWEIYCFTHGLPTRNTGTWLPSTGKPACEKECCRELSMEVWPEVLRRGGGRISPQRK